MNNECLWPQHQKLSLCNPNLDTQIPLLKYRTVLIILTPYQTTLRYEEVHNSLSIY